MIAGQVWMGRGAGRRCGDVRGVRLVVRAQWRLSGGAWDVVRELGMGLSYEAVGSALGSFGKNALGQEVWAAGGAFSVTGGGLVKAMVD